MNIRKASREDCEKIVRDLWTPFMRYCSTMDEFSGLDDGADRIFLTHLQDVVASDKAVVYIAETPKGIIGYVKATIVSRSPVYTVKTMGEISDVFVIPDFRRKGVGDLLVNKAEEWFLEQGLAFARLHVHAANASGRAFWDRMGYQDHFVEKMKNLR